MATDLWGAAWAKVLFLASGLRASGLRAAAPRATALQPFDTARQHSSAMPSKRNGENAGTLFINKPVVGGGKEQELLPERRIDDRPEQPNPSIVHDARIIRQAVSYILTVSDRFPEDSAKSDYSLRALSQAEGLHGRDCARETAGVPRLAILGEAGAFVRRPRRARSDPGPGSGGARLQPHRPHVHGGPLGRHLVQRPLPDRLCFAALQRFARRRTGTARRLHHRRLPLRAARQQAAARGDPQLPAVLRAGIASCCRTCGWWWRWARSPSIPTWTC